MVGVFPAALGGSAGCTGCSRPLRLAVFADDDARRNHSSRRELTELHLSGSVLFGSLLCGDRRLDAMEQAFKPANELCLRNAKLRVRRGFFVREGQTDPFQLLDESGASPSSSSLMDRS